MSKVLSARIARILGLVGLTVVICIAAGFVIGRLSSPPYTDSAEIAHYVAANATTDEPHIDQFQRDFTPLGLVASLRRPILSPLRFDCASRFSYSPGGQPVQSQGGHPQIYPRIISHMLAIRLLEDRYNLKRFEDSFLLSYVLTDVVAFGVQQGYRDSPDCTDEPFKQNLARAEFWKSVYDEYARNQTLFIEYDQNSLPRIDRSRGIGIIIGSKSLADMITVRTPNFAADELIDLAAQPWLRSALYNVYGGSLPNFWIAEDRLINRSQTEAFGWEEAIWAWAKNRSPIAARIIVDERFKGDIMVKLRHWTFDSHGRVDKVDFTSSASVQTPDLLIEELNSLNPQHTLDWQQSPAPSIQDLGRLDMDF